MLEIISDTVCFFRLVNIPMVPRKLCCSSSLLLGNCFNKISALIIPLPTPGFCSMLPFFT